MLGTYPLATANRELCCARRTNVSSDSVRLQCCECFYAHGYNIHTQHMLTIIRSARVGDSAQANLQLAVCSASINKPNIYNISRAAVGARATQIWLSGEEATCPEYITTFGRPCWVIIPRDLYRSRVLCNASVARATHSKKADPSRTGEMLIMARVLPPKTLNEFDGSRNAARANCRRL